MTQIFLLILTTAQAHVLTPSYQEGKRVAHESKELVQHEMNAQNVKTFVKDTQGRGRNPQRGDLEGSNDSPVSSFLLDVYGDRQHFELNPQTDPLFQQGKNALNTVDGKLHVNPEHEYTLHHCREEKLPAIVECEIHKDVKIHRRRVPVTRSDTFEFNYWITQYDGYHPKDENPIFNVGRDKPYDRHLTNSNGILKSFLERYKGIHPSRVVSLQTENIGHPHAVWVHKRDVAFRSYKIHYSYTDEEEEKYPEILTVNGCQAGEDLASQGYYRLHSTTCLDNQNPRVYEDVSVSQSCWREKRVYHATKTAQGNCEHLRKRGCEQIRSHSADGAYEQTFRCKKGTDGSNLRNLPGERPFCLTGDCEDMLDLDDMDFDQAMSQMALLDELGKYAGQPHIFSGKSHSCTDTKFKHCCFKSSGIAVRTGLSKCSSGERVLAKKRGKGICVYVGSRPIKKARIKIGKKKVYCCFPSKLLRVFQEQGRAQLGMGWGKAKHPQCRGLTLQEIQRIDFGQMDLSEAFDEIRTKLKHINVPRAQAQLKRRLQQMKGAIQ